MASQEKWILLGKFYQEWGIRGQIRLIPFNSESSIYPKLREIHLQQPGEAWKALPVTEVKKHGRYWLLKLEGYDTPEASRELRGLSVGIPRAKLPPLRKGEVYLADLEGASVKTHRGEVLGKIKNFVRVGETEVMNIETMEGREVMVPYHSDFVTSAEGELTLKEEAEDLLK